MLGPGGYLSEPPIPDPDRSAERDGRGNPDLGFVVLGHSAPLGVGVSVGYGLLALVSVMPGGLVLLVRMLRRGRRGPTHIGKIELGADVVAQDESAHGGGQRP